MSASRETRRHRVTNVLILVGVLIVVSAMAAVPWGGADTYFNDWLVSGLPLLVIGLVVLAIRAPRYIRGKEA